MQSAMSSRPSADVLQGLCKEALVFYEAGRLEEARTCLKKVVARDPRHFNGLCLLGLVCTQAGQAELAVPLIRRAIAAVQGRGASPAHVAAAHNNLGDALRDLERWEEALASYDKAIALQSGNAQILRNRGGLLLKLRRFEDAFEDYERAVTFDPNDAVTQFGRAAVLNELKLFQAAVPGFDAAIALKPDYGEAYFCRGLSLHELEDFERALASLDAALALGYETPAVYRGRASTLYSLERYEACLASYDQAIALAPDDATAHFGRGTVLHTLNRSGEAVESFDTVIALQPDYPEGQFQRSFSLLRSGQLEGGWRDFEARRAKLGLDRDFNPEGLCSPGSELRHRRYHVFSEQGYGDTIQFIRYAALLKEAGVRCVFSVQAPLESLLRRMDPDLAVVREGEPMPEVDHRFPLLSLPLAMGTTLDSIPAPLRYLSPDPERTAYFDGALAERAKPRIGLAWTGNADHSNDRNRSIAFTSLLPLLSEAVDWVCLQKEIREADLPDIGNCTLLSVHTERLKDFDDTAALIDLMDLVITVDTSIAHLAGALGKPVWILLPFCSDWRWLEQRSDSPWYPTARLFRQSRPGDWTGVVAEVGEELQRSGFFPSVSR